MKLSRTGWNNVIIFSVMGIILLLNVTNERLFKQSDGAYSSSTEVPILGAQAVILTLNINQQLTIERIGQSWRAMPAKISGQALEQMMNAWQQAVGIIQPPGLEVASQPSYVATVYLAGDEQATVLSLYPLADQLLVFNHRWQQWFSLPRAIYFQLLPQEITTQGNA